MHDESPLPPHYLQPLLPTPFHPRARALSQLDSFIPWSGYTTVDVFTTVEQEYFAIRNAATLYDLTPMVKYRVAGPDAAALPQSPGHARRRETQAEPGLLLRLVRRPAAT